VDFDLRSGEVHVLFGENGAGKSTLINIIAGTFAPDAGSYSFEGREVRHHLKGEYPGKKEFWKL